MNRNEILLIADKIGNQLEVLVEDESAKAALRIESDNFSLADIKAFMGKLETAGNSALAVITIGMRKIKIQDSQRLNILLQTGEY